MSMENDYNGFKPTGNKSDIIQGIKMIAAAGGTVLSIITVATWVSSTVFPFMASLGLPVTAGVLAAGARSFKEAWPTLSQKEKEQILEAINWLAKIIRLKIF